MIFVDTSFLFAGFVPDDPHHRAAEALKAGIGRADLVTTNHVVGELWTLARRREGHPAAVEVADRVADRSSRVRIEHVGQGLEREALDWLRAHDEREYSFVDATSFAFMRRQGIDQALAFDADFTAAGFVELRPQA